MNSLVCVDANLILRTLVPGPLSERALALLETWGREKTTLVAPALLAFEVTSTLRRFVHLKHISADHGERAFESFLRINIRLSHQRGIFPLAWRLAQQFDRPRAYDTAYLALAQLRGCAFWTADERLYNAVTPDLEWVQWLGNYRPGPNGEQGHG
jgi:predicted nucleic acid-binding protein